MNIRNNTILITGGATGIGLELTKRCIELGNTVIICARRENKLQEAEKLLPAVVTYGCDLADPEQRRKLFEFCIQHYPNINVLINNAGIQREIDFRKGEENYVSGDSEIAINLEGTLHLTALFIPQLMKQKEAAIINVTSGLALVPLAIAPVYSATKAAVHSFSISLRQQLSKTNVKVFEVLPPVVDTELDRGARAKRGQTERGISVQRVADETLQGLENDTFEIAIGLVKLLRIGVRIRPAFFLKLLNKKVPLRD